MIGVCYLGMMPKIKLHGRESAHVYIDEGNVTGTLPLFQKLEIVFGGEDWLLTWWVFFNFNCGSG